MLCLAVNGVFGFTSSLSPNFGTFMFFRFMSGIGLVVHSYDKGICM